MEKYLISKDTTKKIRRFGVHGRTLEFRIKDIPKGREPHGWVKSAIEDIVLKATEGLNPSDKVGFSFCSKNFSRGEGWMRFKPLADVSTEDLWNTISSTYQSNSEGLNTETFCLSVTAVKMPTGKGRGRKYNTFEEECARRRGIISIKNRDNLCLPRALVVAIAHRNKDPLLPKIRKDYVKIQTNRAKELVEAAGVCIPAEGCGISELQKFQEHLTEYRIVVYRYGCKGRDVIFSGDKVFEGSSNRPSLNLIFNDGHYNVINSLTAAFCCRYFCEECHAPYNNKGDHRCESICQGCRITPPCNSDLIKIFCQSCKRSFHGQRCLENHKKNKICEKIRKCEKCFKTCKSDRVHVCGEIFCKICKKHQSREHLCYIQPDTKSPPTKDFLFIFYDLETRQEKLDADGKLLHEPNLCVFRQCCDSCIDSDISICRKCDVRLQIIKCIDPIQPFTEHILTMRKKFKNVVVLAHNAGKFDTQFVLHYILTKTDLKPKLTMRGRQLIFMNIDNVKFLDSLNYFPMPLSALPKSFGFSEMKKGYFPYLMNTLENQNYIGPMPAIEFYSPGNFKDKSELENFTKWYNERVEENYVFDFQKEITSYCISDVEILAKACLIFRKMMLAQTNVCPFLEGTTIASVCNRVFRRNFLKTESIGIIPKTGYRMRDIQSKLALQWLIWVEHSRQINIQHAAKGKESILHGLKVDGFCQATNQIFEFQGCYWHGCPYCFKHQRDEPLVDNPSETLNFRYEATQSKVERLKSLGYDVVEMWECKFRKDITPAIKEFTESHPLLTQLPLVARDALYGGRTGNTYEYYKAKEGEQIKYTDICSLYPWVCKYGKFPVGYPKVFVGEECSSINLSAISGVIKCSILPPTNLFHPLLPQKMNDKLMFVLCRLCGEHFNYSECNHSDNERTLHGTWVVEEVVKAIELGYKLVKIDEIWSYDSIQFGENVTGLFTEMMNKFIKIKQEASDWPKQCTTKEEKEQYIERFLQREGVLLEYDNICKNESLRCLAKLMLNSFWGKLAQRSNLPSTSIVNNPGEFFAMISNPSIYINAIIPIDEDGNTIIVNWEYKEEVYDPLPTVNVVLASYVTSLARLKLYSYLEKLGDRVLYYDTDSVIYISRHGEYEVPLGEYIGDMTDELNQDSYITEFVSGGPKNYAYKVRDKKEGEEQTVCKVKGISLTLDTQTQINFEQIKKMVLKPEKPISIISKRIAITENHEIATMETRKLYRPNSTKRKFLSDYTSIPFGFKKNKK